MPREVWCDSGRISDRNFRGRQIFRSKSREMAPKCVPPGGAQLRHDPDRSSTSVASVSMLCRVTCGPDFGPKFSKIFAAAKFFVRNRARSHRNPCRLVVRSFLTTA